MCTLSLRSLEEALIQLQYALCDYYDCAEGDRDAGFSRLDASLRVLRKTAVSAQLEINLLGATPKAAEINHKDARFLRVVG
jgi:hypothetical protein